MNELDPKAEAASQDQPVAPAPAANEETTIPAAQEPAAGEETTKEQTPAEAPAAPAEPEAPKAEEAPAEEPAQEAEPEAPAVNYHDLSKEELLDALREIVEAAKVTAHKEVAAIKSVFFNLRNAELDRELAHFVDAGNDPAAFAAMPDEAEVKFKDLLNEFKEKRNSYLEAEEERRAENLRQKQEVLDKMRAIAEDIDKVNVNFQEFQQLQNEFKLIKEIPQTAETEIWRNYQGVVEQFYDHLKMNKELRDLDFKRNLDAKQVLISDAEHLAADLESDIVLIFRKLQDLHARWREIGPVAKEMREEIWDRFKAASTVINKRHQEFFEGRKAQETANEEAKTAICVEVEAINIDDINSFSAWDAATEKIKDAQARWKGIGFASRKNNTALFNRFRATCDKFFERKAEYFKQTKETYATNLAKKEALIAEAEGLKATDDNRKAIDRIVQLQAEWKKIGPVTRKQSDAIWARFQEACNYFFEERRKQNAETRQTETANLAAKREVIAKLKEISSDEERSEVVAKVRELQAEWNSIGHVPFRMKDKLYEEYRGVIDKLFGEYEIKENANRMNRFKSRISTLKGDNKGLSSEREKLLRALDAKRNDLKTFENNLGFFNVKSAAGSSMLAEMERRIARTKEEIAEIESKIALLADEQE